MKKILFLIETVRPTSGWGRVASELGIRLRKYDIEPFFLTEDDSGDLGKERPLKNSLASLKSTLLNVWKVRKYVKQCDLIHSLDVYPYGLIAALANVGINKPFVTTAIATYSIMPLENKKLRTFVMWTYHKVDRIFPITNYLMGEIGKRVKKLPPMERVLLGVDANKFSVKEKTNIFDIKHPYLLTVGALKVRRGHHFVLPALVKVKKKYPNIKYIIAGDCSNTGYVNFLKKTIKELDLEDNVEICGMVSENEMLQLYQNCLAFVLISENSPTYFASFHLVQLEAYGFSKPVISAEGYGADEVVIEGKTGYLVDPNDSGVIAERIIGLLDDTELTKKLGEQANEFARELSWDKMAEGYVKGYEKVFEEKSKKN